MTTHDANFSWSYSCKEYFASFADGRFDGDSQLWFILPRSDTKVYLERGAFVVGSAGADGIDFCFRKGQSGVWAYYPIEDEWGLKADTLAEFERGWLNGSIVV